MLATIGGAVCLAGVLPGVAAAAECPVQPTAKTFAQFGDANDYYLAPGGAFETLTWARIGSVSLSYDADPFELAPGIRSVKLDDNESVSTSFCVDRTMPHMRFVAKGAGGLQVAVRTTYPGNTHDHSETLSEVEHASWAPSRFIDLKARWIPAGLSGTTTITMRGVGGSWRVDNVFVDPYRR